jgi:hypothetical protein
MRRLARLAHVAAVLAIVVAIVAPVLPASLAGAWPSKVSTWERWLSIRQGWQMYSPNPQRAQSYMNLEAVDAAGTRRPLEESEQEENAWGTHWAWNKTRVDIWRQYANFSPKKVNRNRVWYLKAMCVREARRGPIPQKIVMYQVRRRFAPPQDARSGKSGLGRPVRDLITVQYCKSKEVLRMIDQDRTRRGSDADAIDHG